MVNMKIKRDFVTNSSSTSFCAWGYRLDFDNDELPKPFLKKAHEFYIDKNKNIEKPISYELFEERIKNWYDNQDLFLNSVVSYIEKTSNLDLAVNWEAGQIFIGESPFYMSEDITMPKFKEQISKNLKDIGLDLGELQMLIEIINS